MFVGSNAIFKIISSVHPSENMMSKADNFISVKNMNWKISSKRFSWNIDHTKTLQKSYGILRKPHGSLFEKKINRKPFSYPYFHFAQLLVALQLRIGELVLHEPLKTNYFLDCLACFAIGGVCIPFYVFPELRKKIENLPLTHTSILHNFWCHCNFGPVS